MAKKKISWTFGKNLFGLPTRTDKKTKRTETLKDTSPTGKPRWRLK